MKTLAIIAEYNPFHNGHKYHLTKAKELTGADYSIALMSGAFLQRGLPAMWDKYTRATMAASSGIDLTLELPFVYATGSAKDFSTGAVNILDRLNIIDYLVFGAETDDINLLTTIADILNSEPDAYKEQLGNGLSSGLSFPQARANAIVSCLKSQASDINEIINQPNNILAIEYIAALRRINSRIKPIIIKRHNAMYHDPKLYGSISSATAIRAAVEANCITPLQQNKPNQIESLKSELPDTAFDVIKDSYLSAWPVTLDDLTPYLQYCLLNPINYNEICDISEDFANKLYKISPATNYQEAINALSSKDVTGTRVCRSLIHLIMNYKEQHRNSFIEHNYGLYANILSFRKECSQLIKAIKQQTAIPLITKKADFDKCINAYPNINSAIAHIMWNYDMRATQLFNCMIYNRYKTKLPNDYNIQLPIL